MSHAMLWPRRTQHCVLAVSVLSYPPRLLQFIQADQFSFKLILLTWFREMIILLVFWSQIFFYPQCNPSFLRKENWGKNMTLFEKFWRECVYFLFSFCVWTIKLSQGNYVSPFVCICYDTLYSSLCILQLMSCWQCLPLRYVHFWP